MRDMTDVSVVGGNNLHLPPRRSSLLSSSSISSPFPSPAVAADALVTTRFLGYLKVWRATNRIFDSVDLHLPDVQLRTRAAFCRVPASAAVRCRDEPKGIKSKGEGSDNNAPPQPELREGLHAACHALLSAAPAILGCDSSDLGTECDSPYDSRFRPMRLLLWEKNGGGNAGGGGLAERAADSFGELLLAALDIVAHCPSCCSAAPPPPPSSCSSSSSSSLSPPPPPPEGCPECTFWSGCSEYNAVLHRGAARIVLEETIRAAEAAAAAFDGVGGSGGNGAGDGGGGLF